MADLQVQAASAPAPATTRPATTIHSFSQPNGFKTIYSRHTEAVRWQQQQRNQKLLH